jgi:hypothetical protein
MKKKLLLLQFSILSSLILTLKLSAQNADEIIFNQYKPRFNYAGASFVIDSGTSLAKAQKRAFLIWATNQQQDTLKRNLSLSEYDPNLNFLTEQGSVQEKLGSLLNMFPKKIIKSKFERAYYLLSFISNSNIATSGFKVYSTPAVYKIDATTLNIIWAEKINLAAISATNANTVIEYNDIIETSDKNIVLVGRYADNVKAKESILVTKLKGATGIMIWRHTYKLSNCNEAANSVAETTDKRLSLTGYIKKCSGQSFNGNADLFYMQLLANGTPVPGSTVRYNWPSNLDIWGDKITCYTAISGSDQLIISGYVDMQVVGAAADRQILIMNLKENGALITAQQVGDPKTDVCNDLIFKNGGNNNYLIYLTGQTSNYNSQDTVTGEAYFMYANFTASSGMTGLNEFSIFPVTTPPFNRYTSRTGLEIKNAGDYNKFAILTTGVYQPVTNIFQTYTDVLVRDFSDKSGKCIKQAQPPFKQFTINHTIPDVLVDTPQLRAYKIIWLKLSNLIVTPLCQHVQIDPSHALNIMSANKTESQSIQTLHVNPNPAQSAINISIADGSKLTGNYKGAVLMIFNYAMQTEKIVRITPAQGSSISLSVAGLTPGMYRIQLIRENEAIGCSFIKE